MIHEVKSYSATCDNCGDTFEDYHSGFSLFVDDSNCFESMDNAEWYTGCGDPEHEDKHYCPLCFKYHEEEDDKIIVDLSRKKITAPDIDKLKNGER